MSDKIGIFEQARDKMCERLRKQGIENEAVLAAFATVPRERFVPRKLVTEAYSDGPLYIGYGQTISQPYIVAYMLELLRLSPTDRVLEIGAGSGYVTALLSLLSAEIFAIERNQTLYHVATERMIALGYDNVTLQHGDGRFGYAIAAPFNAILVSACAPEVPHHLKEQLQLGGRLVMPVGRVGHEQILLRLTRLDWDKFAEERLGVVSFVPLSTGVQYDDLPTPV